MASSHRLIAGLIAGTLITALAGGPALAQDVTVTLNGAPLDLNPAPVTREGRVFVPLRGVFERLGASVVYDNGTINAQGHGHSVQLHIGSTDTLVDGTSAQVDVAPFIIGASTYVPLRFISQALGARVGYDAASRVVALSEFRGAPNEVVTPMPRMAAPPPMREAAPPPNAAVVDVHPGNGSMVRDSRPEISGRFAAPVDVNTVHVSLDGRDVTGTSYLNARQFTFTPNYDLPARHHDVEVTGRTQDGAHFDRHFDFTSGE